MHEACNYTNQEVEVAMPYPRSVSANQDEEGTEIISAVEEVQIYA